MTDSCWKGFDGYIYYCGESEWKLAKEEHQQPHEPFNPMLKAEFEGIFKLAEESEEELKHLCEDCSGSTSGIIHNIIENEGSIYYIDHELPITNKTKHPLDVKYPHRCFKCKKELKWTELLTRNFSYKFRIFKKGNYEQYKYLKKLWRSKVVQFYCCICYQITLEEGNGNQPK